MFEAREETPKTVSQGVTFLPRVYKDTVALLLRAHEYFSDHGKHAQAEMAPAAKLLYSSEMSRITLRLTSIMAWLTVRKAVFEGSIPPEKAQSSEYSLAFKEACMQDDRDLHDLLPDEMQGLLQETRELYERIHRLDRLVAGEEQPMYAHS